MPTTAWAALASTTRLMRFSPAMSVTEYIMVISLTPTYAPTSPAATVETISLGRPMGSSRMPAVPRSSGPSMASTPSGWWRATASAAISTAQRGWRVPTSTMRGGCRLRRRFHGRCSSAPRPWCRLCRQCRCVPCGAVRRPPAWNPSSFPGSMKPVSLGELLQAHGRAATCGDLAVPGSDGRIERPGAWSPPASLRPAAPGSAVGPFIEPQAACSLSCPAAASAVNSISTAGRSCPREALAGPHWVPSSFPHQGWAVAWRPMALCRKYYRCTGKDCVYENSNY